MVFVSHEVPFAATSDRRSQVAGNGTEWEVKIIELSSSTRGGEQWAFLNLPIFTEVKKTVLKWRKKHYLRICQLYISSVINWIIVDECEIGQEPWVVNANVLNGLKYLFDIHILSQPNNGDDTFMTLILTLGVKFDSRSHFWCTGWLTSNIMAFHWSLRFQVYFNGNIWTPTLIE